MSITAYCSEKYSVRSCSIRIYSKKSKNLKNSENIINNVRDNN